MIAKRKVIFDFFTAFLFSAILLEPGFSQSPAFFVRATGNELNLIVGADFTHLADAASPAVVDIETESQQNAFLSDPFFNQFFATIDPHSGKSLKETIRSNGSAVLISPNGYLLTCAHVIENAQNITVRMADRREFKAKCLAVFPEIDIAVLKITEKLTTDLPYVKCGSAKNIKIGTPVAALGNSFNLGQNFTNGIISANKRRLLLGFDALSPIVLQHNAAVNPGNSGGALVDQFGNLLAINNAIYSKDGGSNGVAFAIPIDLILAYLIKFFDKIPDFSFDFSDLKSLSNEDITMLRKQSSFSYPGGVVVLSLAPDSIPYLAGVREGDIIVSIDDIPIDHVSDITFLESTIAKKDFTIILWRNGALHSIKIVPEILLKTKSTSFTLSNSPAFDGVEFSPLTKNDAKKKKLRSLSPKALVVMSIKNDQSQINNVVPNVFDVDLFSSNTMILRENDIVLEVNGHSVFDEQSLNKAIQSSTGMLQLQLIRNNTTMQISLSIPTVQQPNNLRRKGNGPMQNRYIDEIA